MAKKKWIVIVDWKMGNEEDADELTVFAETEAEARKKALAQWHEKIGSRWPGCEPTKCWVLSGQFFKSVF